MRRMRGVCGKVIRRLLRLRLAVAFQTWQEGAVERKRARGIVMRALRRLQLGACAGAFSRWVEVAAEMRAEREQADAAAQKAAVDDQRKLMILGRVLKIWGQRTLSMSFGLWQERTTEMRRMRGVCGKVFQAVAAPRAQARFLRVRLCRWQAQAQVPEVL